MEISIILGFIVAIALCYLLVQFVRNRASNAQIDQYRPFVDFYMRAVKQMDTLIP